MSQAPRAIDPAIEVLPGTDVEAVWDRFEVFEALHHSMLICNPLSSAQLDEAVEALELSANMLVLDVACGYGELLRRIGRRAPVETIGIDLSPWMIGRAVELSRSMAQSRQMRWVLGEARDFWTTRRPDVALCVGAEWIWHDVGGTAGALAQRVDPGAQVVIGAERLHHAADARQVRDRWGAVATVEDRQRSLETNGLDVLHRIDADDAGWDDYLDRSAVAAAAWAARYPGERAERWLAEQAEWQAARERDREILGWSLWIARKRPPGV